MDQYFTLTNNKQNAGDFLIGYRALQLLAAVRPDRAILNAKQWEPFSEETLEQVNQSRALILAGGPSIQLGNALRSPIYPMVPNLNDIKVPIIMMGVGYKGVMGHWQETNDFHFAPPSLELLRRINESGYVSSVRDYHTLNVMLSNGFDSFMVSGDPALYDLGSVGKPFNKVKEIKTIGFSIGVSFLHSAGILKMMQRIMDALLEEFPGVVLTAFFHQPIDRSVQAFDRLLSWLEQRNIAAKDITGSEQKLFEAYSNVDLHVGYRVHAHIFASSISKPSVLISEDGRAVALRNVIGGLIYDGFPKLRSGAWWRFRRWLPMADRYILADDLPSDIVHNLRNELRHGMPRLSQPRINIDHHFAQMKKFLLQLP